MSGCGADGPWHRSSPTPPRSTPCRASPRSPARPVRADCGPGYRLQRPCVRAHRRRGLLLGALHPTRRLGGEGQHIESPSSRSGLRCRAPRWSSTWPPATGPPAGNRRSVGRSLVNDVLATCAVARSLLPSPWSTPPPGRWPWPPPGRAPIRPWPRLSSGGGPPVRRPTRPRCHLQAPGVAAGRCSRRRRASPGPIVSWQHRQFLIAVDTDLIGRQHPTGSPARSHPGAGERLGLPYRPAPDLGQHDFGLYTGLLGGTSGRVAEAMGDGLLS